jgi:hypothetical protein
MTTRVSSGPAGVCSIIRARRRGIPPGDATTRPRILAVPVAGFFAAALSRGGRPGSGAPTTPPGRDGVCVPAAFCAARPAVIRTTHADTAANEPTLIRDILNDLNVTNHRERS